MFTAHEGAVSGIISDGLNQMVISGGVDAQLKFWNFKTGALLCSIQWSSGINQLVMNREK